TLSADEAALWIKNGRLDHMHVPYLSPQRLMFFLDSECLAGLLNLLIIPTILFRLLGRKEVVVVFAEKLNERLPEHLAEALVTEREPALKILAIDAEGDVLHQRVV